MEYAGCRMCEGGMDHFYCQLAESTFNSERADRRNIRPARGFPKDRLRAHTRVTLADLDSLAAL